MEVIFHKCFRFGSVMSTESSPFYIKGDTLSFNTVPLLYKHLSKRIPSHHPLSCSDGLGLADPYYCHLLLLQNTAAHESRLKPEDNALFKETPI